MSIETKEQEERFNRQVKLGVIMLLIVFVASFLIVVWQRVVAPYFGGYVYEEKVPELDMPQTPTRLNR